MFLAQSEDNHSVEVKTNEVLLILMSFLLFTIAQNQQNLRVLEEGNRLKCLSKSFNNSEMISQETDKNLKDLLKNLIWKYSL